MLVLGVFFVTCGEDMTQPPVGLEGGVLATFDVGDERFRVWVTSTATIAQLYALWEGRSLAGIPIGPVRRASGKAGHNAPWSWHLDPEETSMAEVTIELCDGLPSYVEEHLEEWIEAAGSYCPWGATLAALEDFR